MCQINAVLLNFLFIKVSQKMYQIWVIRNVSLPPNQYIRRISEESCDTGDWCNDCITF